MCLVRHLEKSVLTMAPKGSTLVMAPKGSVLAMMCLEYLVVVLKALTVQRLVPGMVCLGPVVPGFGCLVGGCQERR